MLDRAIAVLGLALGVIFGTWSLAPEGWPKMPAWAIYLGLATGILLFGIAVGMFVSDYRRKDAKSPHFTKWPEPYTPISVIGKTFRNAEVLLDGYSYSNCEFHNVTFKYNGTTAVQISHSHFYHTKILTSDNPAVQGAWATAFGMGMSRPDVRILDLPAENVLKPMEERTI